MQLSRFIYISLLNATFQTILAEFANEAREGEEKKSELFLLLFKEEEKN